jgi:two-component system alkaline phosphatase synthesis response regulator PhoP
MPTLTAQRRILLVDDDPGLVTVLNDALTAEGYAVATARDGESAIARALNSSDGATERGFDLVLLDVNLPGRNGFEVCRELRRRNLGVPIVMLTAHHETSDKVLGLGLGADDYVTKPFDTRELLARIQALLRRVYLDGGAGPVEYRFGRIFVDFLAGKVLRDGQPVSVPTKELQLLHYLVARRGTTVPREELLREVWHYSSALTRTVDVHVAGLRQKIEDNPQHPRFILTVRGEGYLFRG